MRDVVDLSDDVLEALIVDARFAAVAGACLASYRERLSFTAPAGGCSSCNQASRDKAKATALNSLRQCLVAMPAESLQRLKDLLGTSRVSVRFVKPDRSAMTITF